MLLLEVIFKPVILLEEPFSWTSGDDYTCEELDNLKKQDKEDPPVVVVDGESCPLIGFDFCEMGGHILRF